MFCRNSRNGPSSRAQSYSSALGLCKGTRSLRKICFCGLVLLVGAFASAAADSASMRIKPGLWQMHTEVTAPTATQPLVRDATECVSEADAQRSFSEMIGDIQGTANSQECVITEIDEMLGQAVAKMHCDFPSLDVTTDATFEIRYTQTEFELTGEMTTTIAAQSMLTRFANKGTWASDSCR